MTSHLCPLLEWNAKKSTIKLEVYYSVDALNRQFNEAKGLESSNLIGL